MFYAVGERSESEGVHFLQRFFFCKAVGHYPRQFWNLRNPASVLLSIELDHEVTFSF